MGKEQSCYEVLCHEQSQCRKYPLRAKMALCRAKHGGKNRYVFFKD